LGGRTWLVGRTLTVADFTLASSLMHTHATGVKLDSFANVKAWFEHISELDAWQATEPKR
jgi:glutathione S-transferase